MEFDFLASPFLKLPHDASIWKLENGKESHPWWVVDVEHSFFGEGKPYDGVVHAEVLCREDEDVFNLSVERTDGVKVFSFGFPSSREGEMNVFIESDSSDHRKALRILCELLHHLPEGNDRKRLLSKVSKQCSLLEIMAVQKIWDKV